MRFPGKVPVAAAIKIDPSTTAEFDPLNNTTRAPHKQEGNQTSAVLVILTI